VDRKALIAIVLSTVLIIAYQLVFLKPPPEDATKPLVAEGSAPSVGSPSAPEGAPAESGVVSEQGGAGAAARETAPLLPEEEGESRTVRVSTPLYEVGIDTRGAVIRSIRLLRFLGADREPVALVDTTAPPALGLLLDTREGEIDLSRAIFTADREEIRLAEGAGEAVLTLEKRLPNGLSVRRSFHFHADGYRIDLEQTIAGTEEAPKVYSYSLAWAPGIAFTEANRQDEHREMAAVTALAAKVVRDPASKVKVGQPVDRAGGVRFAALKNKYFAIALVPEQGSNPDVRIERIAGEDRVSLSMKLPFPDAARDEARIGLYAGPLEMDALKREKAGLEAMIDLGWSWIRPISSLTLAFMTFLYRYVPNYGVVILLISLITKLLFYRLTSKSLKSMKDMQRIQGQMGALREKFKSDPQRLNKETMALYKREGVNPLSGCLPMVLQMPVFIALYQVLQRTIALRKAPFLWWIDDLSQPDVLATLPFSLPFLGTHLSLLPLLMGGSMVIQQKMTTVDPRQKAMIYLMPILFTGLFYRLPSGLVLYWLVNNVLSIGQQYMMNRGDGKDAGRRGSPPSANEGPKIDNGGKKATGRGRLDAPSTKESK
jgi:YidC/Oxa1 family membrane protein insertase